MDLNENQLKKHIKFQLKWFSGIKRQLCFNLTHKKNTFNYFYQNYPKRINYLLDYLCEYDGWDVKHPLYNQHEVREFMKTKVKPKSYQAIVHFSKHLRQCKRHMIDINYFILGRQIGKMIKVIKHEYKIGLQPIAEMIK